MSDQDTTPSSDDAANNGRVKFQGIVETDDARELSANTGDAIPAIPIAPPRRNWNRASRQIWQFTRLSAILMFFVLAVGWPVGAYWSHLDTYGTSAGWFATYRSLLSPSLLMFTVFVPALIVICGYLLSHAYRMINAAESIAGAAREFIHPDQSAVYNAEAVGFAVRGQMTALNTGVDDALQRLASVEAMIRNHVEAIETAGTTIETKTTGAVDRVASERSRLIELTENLNTQADAFATAIAERAQAGIEAIGSADDMSSKAESLLEERLTRLETAAARALQSFEALSVALHGAEESLQTSTSAIETSADKARAASEAASKASKEAAENISRDAEAISAKAVKSTIAEAEKISAAAAKALEDVGGKTKAAVDSATAEAKKATASATNATAAAGKTSEAAAKASAEISKAGAAVEKSTSDALAMTEKTSATIEERNKALAEARAALEKENQRLETLIGEQRSRADRLADAIATQTERLSKLAEAQLREQEAAEKLVEAQAAMQTVKPVEPQPLSATPAQDTRVLNLGKAARRKPAAQSPSTKSDAPKTPVNNDRLDQLAKDIAATRPKEKPAKAAAPIKKGATAKTKNKDGVSWKEILDATDDADPLDLAAASKTPPATNGSAAPQDDTANAIKIIGDLQSFTLNLETRLYGDPPPALRERFDRGDRNVFANRILRLNEADVKRRIRMESGRDRDFESGIHNFLQGFERLLEDATTSETADEDLEEYLSSPLGRVYLLIGATVGYFA